MAEINDNSKETNIKSTIDVIKGLAEAVPVYSDVVQPAAKEVGKSLAVVAKTVNIALAPVSALVWGFEKIKEFVHARVSEKLKEVPEEKIITPDPAIVGPSLEALRYSGNDINLRELYASLIATAMNVTKVEIAHPAFVEIIKNLSSDEAILINYIYSKANIHPVVDIHVVFPSPEKSFLHTNISVLGEASKVNNIDLAPNYIDNLCRLGIIRKELSTFFNENSLTVLYFDNLIAKSYEEVYEPEGASVVVDKRSIVLTEFGKQFCKACLG